MLQSLKNRCSIAAVTVHKGLNSLRQYGVRVTWGRVLQRLYNVRMTKKLAGQELYSAEELEAQRAHRFPLKIKFSITVPLYNTPEAFLREMIESVLAQTYADWELCLADGSDAEHGGVERVCREYAQRDSRVLYRRLEKNLGISGNTNACLEMATGEYIGLFDHDDLLHPAALHEVMCAICELNADFIYTDEATFMSPRVDKIVYVHFKPDFAPDNLRANNYICHFTVFSAELLDRAGRLRPEFDGSQDHDLVLRLTEKAACVAHIPEILYYWRSHPGSVAQDIGVKSYAVEAGIKAVSASIARAGDSAQVSSSPLFPSIYKVRYALRARPRLSVILPVRQPDRALACLSRLREKTSYPDWELLLVAPEGETADALERDRRLAGTPAARVCRCGAPFSRPACLNFGAAQAAGEYLVFLDEAVELLTPDWLEQLLMYAQRCDVGAAGAIAYNEQSRSQQNALMLGFGGEGYSVAAGGETGKGAVSYTGRLSYAQNCMAVSASCMMIRAALFSELGGLDEGFAEGYDDLDLCLRLREKDYLLVWTPDVELRTGAEKAKSERVSEELRRRREAERERFYARWGEVLAAGDPYQNPNMTSMSSGFFAAPKLRQYKARGTHGSGNREETLHEN